MTTTTTRNPSRDDIRGSILRETDRAYYVTLNQCSESCWIPKSQLADVEVTGAPGARMLDATVPMWLSRKLPWNTFTGHIPQATKPW